MENEVLGMNCVNYETIDKLNEISEFLEDDLSEIVLKQRFLANLTGDLSYIHNMLKYTKTFDFAKSYDSYLEIDSNYGIYKQMDVLAWIFSKKVEKDILVFGAGRNAKNFIGLLNAAGIRIKYIIDNNLREEYAYDIPVVDPKENKEMLQQAYIIITSVIYAEEMSSQLKEMGVSDEDIYKPDDNSLISYSEDVYFDLSIWKARKHEIFVDAGCYNLYTSKQFSNWCPSYDKIYAFEPDEGNCQLCNENIEKYGLHNVDIINAGLWNENKVLRFNHSGDKGAGSYISQEGIDSINAVKLDDVLQGKKCTFLKMDIEGSELNALKGAAETIKKWKPRLAICIYHKPEDIIEIPLYVKKLVPEYKLKMRQYSTYFYDTVMYAYID